MKNKFTLGQVVSSTSGRDKSHLYLVVGYEEQRVLVADGKRRKIELPKRKNPLHLRGHQARSLELGKKLTKGEKVKNQELRGFLVTTLDLENNTTPSRGGEE